MYFSCFPLADSDGTISGISPSQRFKVRYCMATDLGKCSQGIKIFGELQFYGFLKGKLNIPHFLAISPLLFFKSIPGLSKNYLRVKLAIPKDFYDSELTLLPLSVWVYLYLFSLHFG
jgi:hypothetical protein